MASRQSIKHFFSNDKTFPIERQVKAWWGAIAMGIPKVLWRGSQTKGHHVVQDWLTGPLTTNVNETYSITASVHSESIRLNSTIPFGEPLSPF
jgi:hypothetical protein